MHYDLVVSGGEVVTPAGVELLDIAVQGGLIAALGRPGAFADAPAARSIDATGCIVMPGGVDPHCHYNQPYEAIRCESQQYSPAAAHGGNTTLIDFALQWPGTSLHEAIRLKQEEAAGAMAIDYGLHAILCGDVPFEVIEEIGDVIRAGIPTIKTMTTYASMTDDGHRWGIMSEVAAHGGMSVVHAEDDDIANWLTRKYLREGKRHGAYIAETRGPLVEEAAIRRVMLLAERSGSPLYILHMAAGSGVQALTEGRDRGLPFYGETLTPYLSFTADNLWDDERRGLLWNNFPTIKQQEDQDLLWAAIGDDRLQVVSSDHFAVSAGVRYERMGTTIDSMQAGQAGVELRLPVLYHLGVAGGRISLQRFVELVSANPAKLMGLYPKKGVLAVGSDADITLLDPERSWVVDHRGLHMSVDYSCWDGWELSGKVRTTILRGQILVEDERFVGPAGAGQYLPRTLAAEMTASPPTLMATMPEAAVGRGSAG